MADLLGVIAEAVRQRDEVNGEVKALRDTLREIINRRCRPDCACWQVALDALSPPEQEAE